MADSPYSNATTKLGSPEGSRWRHLAGALPPTALSFVAIPLIFAGLSLARGSAVPTFVSEPGFLATLACASIGSGLLAHASPLPLWARLVLAPLVAGLAIVVIVVALHVVAR